MSKSKTYHANFAFTYRADCTTCENYVGLKRSSESKAIADANIHKGIPGNEDHDVKIEVTQSYHII